MVLRECKLPDCSNTFTVRSIGSSRQYCSTFCAYTTRRPAPSVRFWPKVDKNGPIVRPDLGACWVWTARRLPSGYGSFQLGPGRGKTTAQRFSYELAYGVDPGNLDVCHHCDNPPCVRPSHLFLGTASDNAMDMVAKGRHGAAVHPEAIQYGEHAAPAKLTDEQVIEIRARLLAGETPKGIAPDYPVKACAISHIKTGRTWRRLHPSCWTRGCDNDVDPDGEGGCHLHSNVDAF